MVIKCLYIWNTFPQILFFHLNEQQQARNTIDHKQWRPMTSASGAEGSLLKLPGYCSVCTIEEFHLNPRSAFCAFINICGICLVIQSLRWQMQQTTGGANFTSTSAFHRIQSKQKKQQRQVADWVSLCCHPFHSQLVVLDRRFLHRFTTGINESGLTPLTCGSHSTRQMV